MNHFRRIVGLVLFLAPLAPLAAETIAVSVRNRNEEEAAPLLAGRVEQGAMDYLFGAGHIVFNLDLDPSAEFYHALAIDQARIGGAAFLVVAEIEFTVAVGQGLVPDRVQVVVIDLEAEDEIDRFALRTEDLERSGELSADTIADRLGGRASELATESMKGGDPAW